MFNISKNQTKMPPQQVKVSTMNIRPTYYLVSINCNLWTHNVVFLFGKANGKK
jgi:hypothetical protein